MQVDVTSRGYSFSRRSFAYAICQAAACFVLGFGVRGGFGFGLTAVFVAMQLMAILCLWDRRFRWFPKTALALLSTYAGLFSCELLLQLMAGAGASASHGHGPQMYEKDEAIGYKLAANWTSPTSESALVIATNSLGHRDSEPVELPAKRALALVGDSFTFGAGISQEQTIDKAIEAAGGGNLDAYNCGVPGYGPPQILETQKRSDLPFDTVVYLYYPNDLTDYGINPAPATVFDGFLVQARGPDGRKRDEEELRAIFAASKRERSNLQWGAVFRLKVIRSRVRPYFVRELLDPITAQASPENVEVGVSYVSRMRDVAQQRAQHFAVFIIPTAGEAENQRYSWLTKSFIEQTKLAGIETIDVLGSFDESHYLDDGHFNAAGAKVAGKQIAAFSERRGTQ